MTDRFKGCTVLFTDDFREDDAEVLLSAIRMLRGVAAVTPELMVPDDWYMRTRVEQEMRERLLKALSEKS